METLNDEEMMAFMNDEIVQLKLGNLVEVGLQCETLRENIQLRKHGRDVALMNSGLSALTDLKLRAQLMETKRKMREDIDKYRGDDPLDPWIRCIKWVEQAFPSGAEYSGLVRLYEECARSFWDVSQYKEDRRYLRVWVKYASYCKDAEVIYKFLYAHEIGQRHDFFYSSYALALEKKNKLREADSIFSLGLARKAEPLEKLRVVYRSFLRRLITRRQPEVEQEGSKIDNVPVRCFGTVLNTGGTALAQNANLCTLHLLQRADTNVGKPLLIYRDENSMLSGHNNERLKSTNSNRQKLLSCNLSTKATPRKENNPFTSNWNSSKVFPRTGSLAQTAASTTFEIYRDEECTEHPKSGKEKIFLKEKQLKPRKEGDKKETELLVENPLRNFPREALDIRDIVY